MPLIPVCDIEFDHGSHRDVNPAHKARLRKTLREGGKLPPIGVIPNGEGAEKPYRLLWGGHRLSATIEEGQIVIDAMIEERPLTAGQAVVIQWKENEDRLALDHAARVNLYLAVMKEEGCTQEDLAELLGTSSGRVSKDFKVHRNATEYVRSAVASGQLGISIAHLLVALPADQMDEVAARVVKERWKRERVEKEVKRRLGKTLRKPRSAKIKDDETGIIVMVPGDTEADTAFGAFRRITARIKAGQRQSENPIAAPIMLPPQ
jgi:ParB-like chromosome segregation protein Spo0J